MGKYEQALASLNDAQRQAVTTIEGPVLVVAGPGTGKTQLLATRIAYILSNTDTLPENILCLTFTESAAQNMRQRLQSLIGQAAYKITISTYHAFGSDLIKRFGAYLDNTTQLEPADDLAINNIFHDIISGLPFSNPLSNAETYIKDVISFVSDAKRATLTPNDLRQLAKENMQFIEHIQSHVHQALDGLTRMTDKSAVERFQKLADSLTGGGIVTDGQTASAQNIQQELTQSPNTSPNASLGQLFLNSLQQALAEVAETGKKKALTAWKDSWLAKDSGGQFIADGAKANQKLLALADVYQQYLERLASQGLFDYDDMILRAIQALEQHDDLRFTVQEQYLYILLDEFQDTNGAQLRLVELLTDNPVFEQRPNILAVGDDDQAIYAFQGADYSHMLQFQRIYRDVCVVSLTENYRSHTDILHIAGNVANQISERLSDYFPGMHKILHAKATTLPAQAVVERRELSSEPAQLAWVAQKIKHLLDSGLPPNEIAVLAPQHKHLEPLIPYLQALGVPVRYEKRENIWDDPAIQQLLTMARLVLFLQTGQFAKADELWVQVISFDFWQLPTSRIWQLSWQANDDREPWTDMLLQQPDTKAIALFFMRLSMLASTEGLETMLDYLGGTTELDLQEPGMSPYRSPFYDFYFADGGGQAKSALDSSVPETSGQTSDRPGKLLAGIGTYWNVLSNLSVLRAKLRDYKHGAEEEPLQLHDFVGFADAYKQAGIQILNTSPYQTDDNAVQIMTAFKAKGMEFGTVFLLAVSNEVWGTTARGKTNHLSLPANLRYIRYGGASADERLRLFYVAVTRAKSTLYLLNYRQTFAGKALDRLQFLDETVDGDTHISPLLPDGHQQVLFSLTGSMAADAGHEMAGSAGTADSELQHFWQKRHTNTAQLDGKTAQSLLQSRLEAFQLSPTHVNSFIDLEHAGPQFFFMDTILRFPKAPSVNGQFGNVIHETLEWLHNQYKQTGSIPGIADAHNFIDHRSAAQRLPAQDSTRLRERAALILEAYYTQRLHTITSDALCERNFRLDGIFLGSAHMAGKIDKLIVNKAKREVVIVDYKTGRSHSRWSGSLQLHKYKQQLYLYRALVENCGAFAGYTVTDSYLEFVEPDENGLIQELHLPFDSHEYETTKQLAMVVWQHIKNLTIPNVSGYTADLKGSLRFEADLLQEDREV